MSEWSKLPPRQAGIWWFRGSRCPRPGTHIGIDDAVRLQWIQRGQVTELGVLCFGKQTRYRLEQFSGVWKSLSVEEEG